MGTSSEQHYSLRWNDYTVKIVTAFQSLRDEEDFVDVTVACDGHHYSAHKMVLSACSPYFRSLLRANPCQHPIVILKDVGHIEMERLLEFMYNGEVNIAQDQLAAFLKTAESLKIRGLAGSSDDFDQSHLPHNYSCLSGGTGTIGGVSGRNSPSVSFNSSQDCKDDDITTDGIFHTNTTKRRKRSSAVSGVDNSSSQAAGVYNLTGDGIIESGSDRVNISGDQSIDLEDDRMDRRELKSEPSDALGEVYVESSDMALPGPSGSSNHHDGLSHGEANAAAPQSAVCEALNLSLRSAATTPAVLLPHLLNGCSSSAPPTATNTSLPPASPSVSIQRQSVMNHPSASNNINNNNIHSNSLSTSSGGHYLPRHQHALQTPSSVGVAALTLVAPPLVQPQFKCEEHFQVEEEEDVMMQEEEEEKVHPEHLLCTSAANTSDARQMYAPDLAMDLVCDTVDKKPFVGVVAPADYPLHHTPHHRHHHHHHLPHHQHPQHHQQQAAVPLSDTTAVGGGAPSPASSVPVYKTKVYPCPECLKVFRHPMSLHHHRHVHKGTYTCQSCGKVFSRRWDLHRHIHRSKMGCRRPNHAGGAVPTSSSEPNHSNHNNQSNHLGLTGLHSSSSTTPPSSSSTLGGINSTSTSLRPDHPYDLNSTSN